MKLVFCAVVFAVICATQAQFAPEEDAGPFPDYWQNDYDNFYDYPEENNDGALNEDIAVKQEDTDKLVEAEIQDFRDQNEAQDELSQSASDDGSFNALDDYQFEDNRSDNDDKEPAIDDDSNSDEEPMPDDAPEINPDDIPEVPIEPNENQSSENNNENEEADMDDDMWGDVLEDESLEEIAPLPVPSAEKEPSEEEQGEADQDNDDFSDSSPENAVSEEKSAEEGDWEQLIEETNKLLEETDKDFNGDDDSINLNANEKSLEDLFADNNNEDKTPEKVLNDLNDDLDKLFETLDKLSDNDSDLGDSEDNDENAVDKDEVNEVQDYEDKYNRPYKEANILSIRDDYYDNINDDNLPEIFAENDNDAFDNSSEDDKPVQDDVEDVVEQNVAVDDINKEASSSSKAADDQEQAVPSAEESDDDPLEYLDELNKLFEDNNDESDEKVDEVLNKLWRHSYGNDGLVDDHQEINEDAEVFSTTQAVADDAEIQSTTTASDSDEPRSTIMVENLNSAEYNDLMVQFAATHSEILDINSDKFTRNVAPIHIALKVDEPTVITSHNYPNAYPTNNVTDWIIEGPGIGIEMNVTDFFVNGAVGDYLLVKPGGVDASGTDGLIFSFRLNHERRYRFTNVNRVFLRFEAMLGFQFATGFSISARMIWPLPEVEREEVPQPEAVLHPPNVDQTLILTLAGLTLREFNEVKHSFKELVADIAQEYITANELDPGMNTTLEVTQVTKTAVCNIRWPNYETCVEVTFGVPLHYEEDVEHPRLNSEDLDAMWSTYIGKEPYASRLREMGITEYAIPDDRTVLMLWLVIALGVVVAMAMLAFALWRFRCFEDYTRMMAYNDSDSIQKEKKTLDLYPTPHQTLPPLYSDNDYKWADGKYDDSTRVDMGGFANKSYVRDELFDFDSDEDIITPRDRNHVISPRDVYDV